MYLLDSAFGEDSQQCCSHLQAQHLSHASQLTTTLGLTYGQPPTCYASTSLIILVSCGALHECLNWVQVTCRDILHGAPNRDIVVVNRTAMGHVACRCGRGRHPGFGAGSGKRHPDGLWVTGGHRRTVCCPPSAVPHTGALNRSQWHLRPLTCMPVAAGVERLAAQCCAEWL